MGSVSFSLFFFFPQTGEWTDHEQSLLTRAMIKFPGGTPNRWEKIAVEIGRSVEEVSHLSKCLCFVLSRSISTLTAAISDFSYWTHIIIPTESDFD